LGGYKAEKIFVSKGTKREEVEEAVSGEIVILAGIKELKIGQTVTDPQTTEALPTITVEEPTLRVTIGANTSPLAGKEGKFVTSRQVGDRLIKERETNLGLRIEDMGGEFQVAGRGELHLAVLIENMRREGYELQVSKPQVIIKDKMEPYEEVIVDVPDEYVGEITTEMGKRRGEMLDMKSDGRGGTRLSFMISQRNLMGARNTLLTKTRGTVVLNTISAGYKPLGQISEKLRNGVMVAHESGKVLAYSLENAQERGETFVEPGDEVYEGMIVGITPKENDMDISVTKGKHLTNTRSANKDVGIKLSPSIKMSLEQGLDFIEEDELMEVTPKSIRFRKKMLAKVDRIRDKRKSL
jgi:GTP-binding protein